MQAIEGMKTGVKKSDYTQCLALALPLLTCSTMEKPLYIPEPQFLHLFNEGT